MKRFIVIVLDGFGIGAMEDTKVCRPQDTDADTFGHIRKCYPDIKLPNLTKLGLLVARGEDEREDVTCGRIKLAHFGADTFYGHQELMGSKPIKPKEAPFSQFIQAVSQVLQQAGYQVEVYGTGNNFLVVNQAMTVADNIECDLGSAINVTAALDLVDFEEVKEVGRLVRSVVDISRVIAFGGKAVELSAILNAVEEKGDYIGINAPKSGVYNKDYECVHLGYGVDPSVQVPSKLQARGIKTYLVGKVADIVENNYGESYSIVETSEVLKKTLELIKNTDKGFIGVNVQQTDLAGHSQDTLRYKQVLEIADTYLGKIIEQLQDDDLLLVMADHGNDPTIGHSKHTREYVPMLIKAANQKALGKLTDRETLADVGATVIKYFEAPEGEFGVALPII